MELIDLSPIKPMLMRALANPEAIKVFINYHLGLFGSFVLRLLWIFIIGSLSYLAYLLWKSKVWKNKNKKERKKIIKKAFLEYWHKVKKPLRMLRYLIIGGILISCAWLFVSLIFYIYTQESAVYNCPFSPEENLILGYWAFLSLVIFLIAPVFIMFCFGNKFIRNIGILLYIFGIGFISMGRFISIGCAGMEDEEIKKEVDTGDNLESIDKIKEVDDIEKPQERGGLRTIALNNIIPDSVEITVKNEIIEGEAVDLSITIIKDGKKMDNYEGTIFFRIVDENGDYLNPNIHILPDGGLYTFYPTDSGQKNFQKGLEIKREGVFYIEVEDLNDIDETILGRQKITVIKKN